MSFNLTIPKISGDPFNINIEVGDILFVLGANGSGKSSIMHNFYTAHYTNSKRISAHRQTWFASSASTLSPETKRNTERDIQSTDRNPQARWKDDYSAQRASIAIYNLIDAENVRARSIAEAVDNENMGLAKNLSKNDAPIKKINKLLRLSNIPIEISIRENEQVVASKNGCTPYSIAELSDGERNAILIAANVLTVEDGTLMLIDEPERHLHRSIISPLLTLLFKERPECSFIVSTHDVMLPLDNPTSRTLLIRDCVYAGNSVSAWDADLIDSENNINEELKEDILGARRKILFVEGEERSLDKPLYSLIFKDVSIIPKSSCRDIEHAVSSIRDMDNLHWLNVFGIVDNDQRTEDDIARLKEKGSYAISVYSVESIYYHPKIQKYIAERHSLVTGDDATTLLDDAKNAAIDSITPHAKRMSERVVEKSIRENIFNNLPRQAEISAANPINISIDVNAVVTEEIKRMQQYLEESNLTEIISRYPIRETPALSEIAKKLGFQRQYQYEGAVIKLLMDDNEALDFVKSLFGTLEADINAS